MTAPREEGGRLARWSERKRAARKAEAAAPSEEPQTARPSEPPVPEEPEEAVLERLGLPRPEDLKPGDDVTRFMADHVPAYLRKRALRVLWRTNPVLANLDGLNDYDEDFTSPEMTRKVLATAYQVGKGIVSKLPAAGDDTAAEGRDERQSEAIEGEPAPDAPAGAAVDPARPDPEAQPDRTAGAPRADEGGEAAFRPKRMRFTT